MDEMARAEMRARAESDARAFAEDRYERANLWDPGDVLGLLDENDRLRAALETAERTIAELRDEWAANLAKSMLDDAPGDHRWGHEWYIVAALAAAIPPGDLADLRSYLEGD